MDYGFFRIVAEPRLVDVYCPKHYGVCMRQLENGFFRGPVFYCKPCDAVYEPRLIKRTEKSINRDKLNEQLGVK